MESFRQLQSNAARSVAELLAFRTQALDLHHTAEAILGFWTHDGSEWSKVIRDRMPPEVLAPFEELEVARDALSDARRQRDPVSTERAQAHYERMQDLAHAMGAAWSSAVDRITGEWLEQQAPLLRRKLARYETEFTLLRPFLAGASSVERFSHGLFGDGATSSCEVLLRFASAVDEERWGEDFDGFDPDHLRVAVEKELGVLLLWSHYRPGSVAAESAPTVGVARKRAKPAAQGRAKPTPQRRAPTKELSTMAVLVLRALPSSAHPALRTLKDVAKKVDTSPKPSEASVWRAVKEMRAQRPPLADRASYRRTKAGDTAVRLA